MVWRINKVSLAYLTMHCMLSIGETMKLSLNILHPTFLVGILFETQVTVDDRNDYLLCDME